VGSNLAETTHVRLKVEAFTKSYRDYPVAQNIPQLSLANIADTFGQAFLMFPMTNAGLGIARGVEATAETHISPALSITLATSYSRNWYSGLDGVLRRGNFDIPFSANLSVVRTLGKKCVLSARYNVTSGRPYTPFLFNVSLAQDRGIYDLSQVNGMRSDYYGRLDFRLEGQPGSASEC
jgi:hypothetical protein